MSGLLIGTQSGGIEVALQVARRPDQVIAFCNGCFDVLHIGHVRMLREAAARSTYLVVAVNVDADVRKSKGPNRPFVPLAERLEMIASLDGVSLVFPQEDPEPTGIINYIRPEWVVKGPDYRDRNFPERDVVIGYGGRFFFTPWPKEHSTEDLARRIARNAVESHAG